MPLFASTKVKWLPEIFSGVTIGLQIAIMSIACASILYNGVIALILPLGIGLTLLSSMLMVIIVSLGSSSALTIATVQEIPAVLLGIAINAILLRHHQQHLLGSPLPTVLTFIALNSLFIGLCMYLIGHFELGDLVRFIPYPVLSGFLAGAGWLLFKNSFVMLTEKSLSFGNLSILFSSAKVLYWCPAMLYATVIFFTTRVYHHYFVLFGFVFGGFILFYGVLLLTGTTLDVASAQHFLLGPFPQGQLLDFLNFPLQGEIHWSLIFSHLQELFSLAFICIVFLLLVSSGFEMAVKQDIDINRELRVHGIANFLIGCVLGSPGYQSLTLSMIKQKFQAKNRVATVFFVVIICLSVLLFGPIILSYLPRMVFGAILMYFGFNYLAEWVVNSYQKLSKIDYAIVIFMLFVIANFGVLQGTMSGILICLIVFVIRYSYIDIIKHTMNGKMVKSNVEYDLEGRQILQKHGQETYILRLQGYLFFGNANNIFKLIKSRYLDSSHPLRTLIIDFTFYFEMDATAIFSFIKILEFTRKNHICTVFSHLPLSIQKKLDQMVGFDHNAQSYQVVSDLDHALELAEKELLKHYLLHRYDQNLLSLLKKNFPDLHDLKLLLTVLKRKKIRAHSLIYAEGSDAQDMFFIEEGSVDIFLKNNGQIQRLRNMKAGTMVGEIGLFLKLPRNASVQSCESCVLHFLNRESLNQLYEQSPKLVASLHAAIIRILAERLVHANQLSSDLMGS